MERSKKCSQWMIMIKPSGRAIQQILQNKCKLPLAVEQSEIVYCPILPSTGILFQRHFLERQAAHIKDAKSV